MHEAGARRVGGLLHVLLRVYPASFRESVGDDLVATLVARWRDARRMSRLRVLRFWSVEVTRFVVDGVTERVRGPGVGSGTGQDVRNALRQVRRAPAFHVLAMAVIALGIGATTTMLTVTDAVVFRPLPYERSADLYLIRSRVGGVQFSSNSLLNQRAVGLLVPALEWVAGAQDWSPALTGAGEPVRVYALDVTREYLPGLGASAVIGRTFTPDDHAGDAAPVAVMSWGLWQRVWGGDASVLGRSVQLNGFAHTIVGVMRRTWRDPEPIESGTPTNVWLPVRDDAEAWADRGDFSYQLIGRSRPGIGVDALRAGLAAAGERLSAEYPADNTSNGAALEFIPASLKERTVSDARGRLMLMLGAALLLLLLACANVANLFLARGSTRQAELSVRGALGASRSRLARQLFAESLVTAMLGGVAGVLLGTAGLRAFTALAPAEMPRLHEAQLDVRALLLVLVAIVATGVISGIVPALRSTAVRRTALSETRTTAGARQRRSQSALVAIEIALALVLVTGSVLLLRSFSAMLHADPGFDPHDRVVAEIRPPAGTLQEVQRTFFDEVLQRSRGIPGVRSAALLYTPPGSGGGMWTRMSAEDADPATAEVPFIRVTPVLGDALTTLGMRLRTGADFDAAVQANDPPTVILNESAARQIFPGVDDPVGHRLRFGLPDSEAPLRTVIGVVADVSQRGPGVPAESGVLAPASQFGAPRYSLVLRMSPAVPAPAAAIRSIVAEVGSGVPVDRIATMTDLLSAQMAEARFLTSLLTTFALLALLLAAVGTYGTASHAVTRRLREMGIRMALGARGRSVLGLLLGDAVMTTAAGIGAGAVLGILLARFIESYVFGIGPRDPLAFLVAATVLAAATLMASLVPALRAARADPNRVLRSDR